MHSSTSNSKTPQIRDIVLLLGACALFCVLLEGGTTFYFARVSKIENRRESEYQDAVAIRSARTHHAASVLVAGNSLLLEGVNFPQLLKAVSPELEPRRLVVENTFYLDWYYGLRRIFKMGAQPDIVVLMLNPIQLTAPAFNGDYSAHLLVDRGDLLEFAKNTGADRNETSTLAMANLSFFYGSRAEIRTWILGKLLPGVGNLFRPPVGSQKSDVSEQLAAERLVRLRDLCSSHGSDLVIVLPPARLGIGVTEVLQAASASGVKVLLPIAPGVLPASDYSDNFHLNGDGANRFTPVLATKLSELWRTGGSSTGNSALSSSPDKRDGDVRPLNAAFVPVQANPKKRVNLQR